VENIVPIDSEISYIGVNERHTPLFENIWPLPTGISYNSYLIRDRKNVLIDTVKINKVADFMGKLEYLLSGDDLHYLIINHMEPDHSGAIPELLSRYPGMEIVGNGKTFEFLKGLYGIEDNLHEVADGDRLNTGKHDFTFYLTPMVHWPETMLSFEKNKGILFSGDAFGGFGSLDGGIFDDEVNIDYFENEIRRYFSNIIGKFSPMVQKAIRKLEGLEISIIASTHGPVWRTDPGRIINSYDRWSAQKTEPGTVIVYGSMYGHTEKMAEYLARRLAENEITNIRVFNSSKTHPSYIINEIWKYNGIILGSCTYNNGLFPPMESVIINLSHKGIKNRLFSAFGTYGWGGGGVKTIISYMKENRWEMVGEPVEARLSPGDSHYGELDLLARKFSSRVME
jgi:flavorubredoxin